MSQLLAWLSSNAAGLGILGAAVAFCWSTGQQVAQRRRESQEREFQTFHRLVKELVSPDSEGGLTWLDRQSAVVFELRHFRRYYEFTERMLAGLQKVWAADPHFQPRLREEIELTLNYIRRKN